MIKGDLILMTALKECFAFVSDVKLHSTVEYQYSLSTQDDVLQSFLHDCSRGIPA